MAKTKHQKLADLMQEILDGIEEHSLQVTKQLNMVQLHFYEPYALFGRPLMNQKAIREMFHTHYLCLQNLIPDFSLRTTCQKFPMLATNIQRPFYLVSECRIPRENGTWMVPWRVMIVLPHENQNKINRSKAQALLYCPEVEEISNEIDWFEHDMASDSLTHQLLSIIQHEHSRAIVRENLLKNPLPIWQQAKEEWQLIPTEESDPDVMYDIAKAPKNVDDIDFAPKEGMSLALAYEAVMKSIQVRSSRQSLKKIYKNALEQKMFEQTSWSKKEKAAFLHEWRDNFFKKEPSTGCHRPGRWKQCESIDDVIASNLIKYFVTEFIDNPQNKKAGEIVCVLWILIWIAQESETDRLTIKQVLQLTTQDIISDDAAITIDGIEVNISWGLKNALLCLRGKGKGLRARRLFASLDISGKSLERALIQASKVILPPGADPVLPAAFLTSPHIYQGVRLPRAQRKRMKSATTITPPRYNYKDIKTALLREKKKEA